MILIDDALLDVKTTKSFNNELLTAKREIHKDFHHMHGWWWWQCVAFLSVIKLTFSYIDVDIDGVNRAINHYYDEIYSGMFSFLLSNFVCVCACVCLCIFLSAHFSQVWTHSIHTYNNMYTPNMQDEVIRTILVAFSI